MTPAPRPVAPAERWWQRVGALIDRNYGTWRGGVRVLIGEIDWIAGRLVAWTPARLERPERLVFVCLGNINRSAFAAEVARRHGLACVSIGLETATGLPAYDMAVVQARAMGYDLGAHRATAFPDYEWTAGDLLLAMEVRHVRRLRDLGIPSRSIALLGHWASPRRIHLHDPHTLSAAYFATCFALIESAVRGICGALGGEAPLRAGARR